MIVYQEYQAIFSFNTLQFIKKDFNFHRENLAIQQIKFKDYHKCHLTSKTSNSQKQNYFDDQQQIY